MYPFKISPQKSSPPPSQEVSSPSPLHFGSLSLYDLHHGLMKKRFSSVELTQEFLQKIEEKDSMFKAFISVTAEQALNQAQAADERRQEGRATLLTGIPIAIKDNIATAQIPTTSGSLSLMNFIPSQDAAVVKRLKSAGAVLLGKLNMDAFALGTTNESSEFGRTRNPINIDFVPGGSSGGSSAAVAGGLCAASLGTDTGGSIRQPAAFCGVVGLKPTPRRIHQAGIVPLCARFDSVGPMTQNVQDCALFLAEVSDFKFPKLTEELLKKIKGRKIAVPREILLSARLDIDIEVFRAFERALCRLRELGAILEGVDLPSFEGMNDIYTPLVDADLFRNYSFGWKSKRRRSSAENLMEEMKKFLSSSHRNYGPRMERRIQKGSEYLNPENNCLKECKIQLREIQNRYEEIFRDFDLIITPTTPIKPCRLGAGDHEDIVDSDLFTRAANLTGIPAISVPFGKSQEGLPLGIQFMAPAFGEEVLFESAYCLEKIQ